MTNQHPITPPPELIQQWIGEFFGCVVTGELSDSEKFLATHAARWGADQELEACIKLLSDLGGDGEMIRRHRRPKLKRLGEIALVSLETIEEDLMVGDEAHPNDFVTIRRALERLQELEGQ